MIGDGRPASTSLVATARSGIISLAGYAFAAVAGFALTIVVAHVLHAKGSGKFFQCVALFTIVSGICKLGADTGLVRALPRLRAYGRECEATRTVFLAIVPITVISVAVSVALWFAAPGLADRLFGGDSAGNVHAIRATVPFISVAAPMVGLLAVTRGLGSVIPMTVVNNVVLPGLRPLLVVLGAALFGVTGAVLSWSIPTVLGLAIATVLAIRHLARERVAAPAPAMTARIPLAIEFWQFTIPRGLSAAVETAITWLDVLIVGTLLGPAAAGIYAAASRFVTSGTMAQAAVRLAIAPQISEMLARNDKAALSRLYAASTQWVVAFAWPLYLLVGIFAPSILGVFGSQFRSAAPALSMLSVAMMIVLGAGSIQSILLMSGRSAWQLTNKAGALTIMVGLDFLLVPSWHLKGAALGWSLALVADAVAAAVEIRNIVNLMRNLSRVALVAVMTLACVGAPALAARLAWGSSVRALAASALVGGLLYLVTLWALRRHTDVITLARAVRPARFAPKPRIAGEPALVTTLEVR